MTAHQSQRPPLFLRIRTYAQRNPRRYGIITGVLSGIFFGGFMAVFFAFFLLMAGGGAKVLWALLAGAASGAFFGVFMGVFHTRSVPSTPLPLGTDRARMREAQRLVRDEVPGPDPRTNQIARHQAEATLKSLYWPKTMVCVFSLGFALNVWSLAVSTGPTSWINAMGLVLFPFMVFVGVPLTVRGRKRARSFLTAAGSPAP